MFETGYVKLHRSLLNWEWYPDQNTRSVFIHLLLTVNFRDEKWRGIPVNRGQRIWTRVGLAKELNMSERGLRTALKHLESTGEVTNDSTHAYSLLTVVHYDQYQKATDETTVRCPAGDQPVTGQRPVYKKEKNIKREECEKEEEKTPARFGEFQMVSLTEGKYAALVRHMGEEQALAYIDRLDRYMASSGKEYRDHYATMLCWWEQDRSADGPREVEVLL